ncbi:hypothetical protein [Clostridium sp. KNHs205]|jgi:hypothetical protein|uniref:hypothetical protein n=1 Tax=Clostridium sp. KNHs205 TaxID=1449050 RepID=UPI00051AC23A|nr:hypothetical protein [Clostridium sp. KNHs205]
MQNKIKGKSASNIMDATGYWREYPERDLEHVRRYPVTVERLDEKDVWKNKYMKVVCVLPELQEAKTEKKEYIAMLQQELKKQAGKDYTKSFCVEKLIIWDRGSQYEESDYLGLLNFVKQNFSCSDDIRNKIVKNEFKDIEVWNYEEPILAAGLGAAGYIKGHDYFNTESLSEYSNALSNDCYPVEKAFLISAQEVLARTIRQGIYRGKLGLKGFQEHHGFYFENVFHDELQKLEEKGYLKVEEDDCIFLQKEKQEEILDSLVKW